MILLRKRMVGAIELRGVSPKPLKFYVDYVARSPDPSVRALKRSDAKKCAHTRCI
jgi:hypothetical protein